jgi:hypothetical protein
MKLGGERWLRNGSSLYSRRAHIIQYFSLLSVPSALRDGQ